MTTSELPHSAESVPGWLDAEMRNHLVQSVQLRMPLAERQTAETAIDLALHFLALRLRTTPLPPGAAS